MSKSSQEQRSQIVETTNIKTTTQQQKVDGGGIALNEAQAVTINQDSPDAIALGRDVAERSITTLGEVIAASERRAADQAAAAQATASQSVAALASQRQRETPNAGQDVTALAGAVALGGGLLWLATGGND